jgi:hypothetical protein
MIWDVNSLANPTLVDSFFSTETVIDHNQYVNGSYVYQANYCAGLRVLEIDDAGAHPELTEVGYFKVRLGRIVASHHRSSTLYHICYDIRCLYF